MPTFRFSGEHIDSIKVEKKRICTVDGCNNKVYKGWGRFCCKHLSQYNRYGKILKRTLFDNNEIILIDDTTAKMLLYNRNCEVVAETIIDKDDIPYVKDIKWHLDDKGYVVNRTRNITLKLHNYIMNHNDFTILVVDHINNNRLDNRKSNLRIVTKNINSYNRKCKGVCYDNYYKKYRAYISVDNKRIELGKFNNEEDAIAARKIAEEKYYPNIKII